MGKKMFSGIWYLFCLVYKLQKKYILCLFAAEILNVCLTMLNIILPKYILDALFGQDCLFQRAVSFLGIYVLGTMLFNAGIGVLKFWSEKSRDLLYTEYSVLQGEKFLTGEYAKLEDPEYLKLREKAAKYINAYGFAGIIPVTIMLIGKIVTIVTIISVVVLIDYRIFLLYFVLLLINLTFHARNKLKIISEDMQMVEAERRRDYIKSVFEGREYAKEIRRYSLKNWLLEKYQGEYDFVNGFQRKKNQYRMKNKMLNVVIDSIQQIIAYTYLIVCTFSGKMSVGNFSLYLSGMTTFNHLTLDIMNTVIDLKQYDEYYVPFKEFNGNAESTARGEHIYRESDTNTIEFRNVWFKYPGQEQYVLKDVNLKMTTQDAICIVGENGAGKTTLIKLLLRLYTVTEGEILLNGVNIQEYVYEDYMRYFSVLFQDFRLFAMSVKDNIVLNNRDFGQGDRRIEKALALSGVNRMLREKGRDVNVSVTKTFDEQGIEFSGGEKQKIALAKTLYKDAPILILDEPTAALDPFSENEVLTKFSDMEKGKMALFISHRLTSVKFCNRILVLDQGTIVEDGTHEELYRKKGLYAQLYQVQAGLYQ